MHVKPWLIKIIDVCAIIALGHGLVFSIIGLRDTAQKADVLIVFGNTVNSDGSLSNRLAARLNKSYELYYQGYAEHIIVSGAVGKEGRDEAVAMKKYLVSLGIPEAAIVQDSAGYNTRATAENSKQIMQQYGWSSVILVSQYFHLPRAAYTFEQLGTKQTYHAHANYVELRDAYGLMREIIAFYKYLIVVR